uniref:Glycosyltransferase n=1 Tax=Candidatus Methanomethylicus mesodigestus TaxID=1867258 RepID=A0A7C3J409_9CREN
MPKATPDKIKVVIYAPAYNTSPEKKYRVNVMSIALSRMFDVKILVDEGESILRGLYKATCISLLSKAWIWDRIGKSIANKLSS